MGNFRQPIIAAGFTAPFVQISPDPISAQRAPRANDEAFDGQIWIDNSTNTVYICAGADPNGTVWAINGGGTFTGANLTVNPGPTSITGNFAVQSNTGSASAITMGTNGAATEKITITNTQGTSTDAISITSLAGGLDLISAAPGSQSVLILGAGPASGVTVASGNGGITLDSTDDITLTAAGNVVINPGLATIFEVASGDLTLKADTGSVIVDGGEAVADAVKLNASNAAGGITATAGTGGFNVSTTGIVAIESDDTTGSDIQLTANTAGGGIDLTASTGGIVATSSGAITLDASAASHFSVAGGVYDLTLSSNLGRVIVDSNKAAGDSIFLDASAVTAGVKIQAGTGGITESSTGVVNISSTAATGTDMNIGAANAAGGVTITSGTGGTALGSTGGIGAVSSAASATAIALQASNAAGGVEITSGTGGFDVDTTGALSLDGAAASNITVTGAFDLTASSTAGRAILSSNKAATDSVLLSATNAAGGINALAGTGGIGFGSTGQIATISSKAAVDAVSIEASDAAGGIELVSGTGGISASTNGTLTMNCKGDALLKTTGNYNIQLQSTLGGVVVIGSDAADDAVIISAVDPAGGITLDAGPTPGVTLSNGTQSAQILVGTGDPNGVVTALQGSIFLRTDGGAGTSLYTNTNGTTGWSAV